MLCARRSGVFQIGQDEMSALWDQRQDCKRRDEKVYVKTFWKNPDASIMAIAERLFALETAMGSSSKVLREQPISIQHRILIQAQNRVQIYHFVKEVLES